ncbi:hypothetical protein GGR06_004168 [Bacteroides reticulotermitis]|uniref:Type II methyltransferase M.TaqI-like domain-containing protein n=1 Tax=Bacteroides reticulotermitis TaxID=1133319 RepID=A0A840DA77_9BACE|nr:hypothetical protein [Bacteroides reticulotermitis]
MAFNKKARLRDNIGAIRIAFDLEKEGRQATPAEREILETWCGFGGIKAVLNPADKPEDVQQWTKTDSELFPLVTQLHDILRVGAGNAPQYNRYVSSLKNSVLSAFYTPPGVVDALAAALKESGVEPVRLLDPSAGTGIFSEAIRQPNPHCEATQFEKDMLTGKILSHLNPTEKVRIEGFENIEPRYNGYFDVVASNIPFGDVAVFDPAYLYSKDPAHKLAGGTIHNYFFMKGVDCVREGGLVAFITSQGVLNSESNRPVREWLMERCEPVSAVRFPNNLFTEHAGTEVGSDLIILQKKTGVKELSQRRQDFIASRKLTNGIPVNNLFQNFDRVIHDNVKVGTDPYGKPAMEFIHSGGVDSIAAELRGMLREDFLQHLDMELYQKHAPQVEQSAAQSRGYQPTAQDWREMGEMVEANKEKDRKLFMQATPEDFSERKSTAQLDWEENRLGFDDVLSDDDLSPVREQKPQEQQYTPPGTQTSLQFDFSEPVPPVAQSQEPTAEAKQQEPAYNIQNQQLISLYDLFGLSAEERTQIKPKNSRSRRRMEIPQPKERQGRKSAKKEDERAPLDWREELMLEAAKKRKEAERQAKKTKTDPKPVYPVADARKEEQPQNLKREAEREERMKPVPFTVPEQGLPKHYKEGSLVTNDDNHIGYLRDLNGFKPMFHPLELSAQQGKRASLYIEIRDTYHHLYLNEADTLRENPALRQMLNRLYDDFTGKFGKLNDPKNLDLIKMDAGGREILSLERYREGKAVKADIFERPVAFNNREITHADNARDALAASLNKHGKVNLEYMAQLTGTAEDGLLSELKGKVYFNPLVGGYEVADKFIAGNVISKADEVQKFIDNHSDHEAAKESLAALREAAPKPIDFDDLDFNFGERWIPTGIYAAYASYLFETDVKVTYASSRDEFSLNARSRNANITEKYGVRSENRLFDGVALMRHAMHDTTPDITKTIKDGDKEVKVPDGQAIQLANSKIDEIRNGFSDWLRQQSPEFKDRLANLYNRTFNCFARPEYDGSHQTFPGLDMKALGIDDLYKSQKDAVWMLKTNGGGICDHEVGAGKTLIMCCGAMEMKRLGLANKPMIIALKANVHEIAQTFCTAYPDAKVLYPGKEDFTPAKRTRIFNEMKNNNWDAVIMTHEQFGMIPQSPEIQRDILQKELDSVEENLEVLRNKGGEVSNFMRRGVEKRKTNLEARLKGITHQIVTRKDDAVDFRLMGIDHLFVDESHYPNLNKIQTFYYKFLIIC